MSYSATILHKYMSHILFQIFCLKTEAWQTWVWNVVITYVPFLAHWTQIVYYFISPYYDHKVEGIKEIATKLSEILPVLFRNMLGSRLKIVVATISSMACVHRHTNTFIARKQLPTSVFVFFTSQWSIGNFFTESCQIWNFVCHLFISRWFYWKMAYYGSW